VNHAIEQNRSRGFFAGQFQSWKPALMQARISLLIPFGFACCLCQGWCASASSLDQWHTRTLPSAEIYLSGITFGGGLFVAVGDDGSLAREAILTSPDGEIWTRRSSGTSNRLNAVAWGNGTYVAVGTRDDSPCCGSSAVVITSTDGLAWTSLAIAADITLQAITFANDLFVAVGIDESSQDGFVMTSSNGTRWISQRLTNAHSERLEGVTHGNGLYVAVSFSPGCVLTSPDAITWTNRGSFGAGWHRAITFADGRFVIAGGPTTFLGVPLISTSTNLEGWTIQSQVAGRHYNPAVAFGGGAWVVVGDDNGRVAYSTDLVSWTEHELTNAPPFTSFAGAAYGRGTFVAVGANVIMQSEPLPTARLAAGPSSEQGFTLTISGEPGLSYRLQSSANLPDTNWTDLLVYTNTLLATNFLDTTATNFNRRFYRVVTP